MVAWHPALHAFDSLDLGERLFVRARLWSAPLVDLAERARGDRVLDVGCGHGVVAALLTHDHPQRHVVGIDLDPRKIEWALASVGQKPRTRFEVASVERLAELEPASFDTVLVADVLYLLTPEGQASFLKACHQLLKPGGLLLLKEVEDDGGWRTYKALAQEIAMVRVLRRTRSSGSIGVLKPEAMMLELSRQGFCVSDVVRPSRFYTTPHVLYCAISV